MSELDRIQDELHRMINGDAWHGPALHELLGGVDHVAANKRSPRASHTIHELVLHISAWLDAVSRRLDGHAYQPTAAEDWPAAHDGAEAWSAAQQRVAECERRLQTQLRAMNDDVLSKKVAGKSYDTYHMLHGVVQHTAYHCGQIALLKRLL